MRILKYVKKSLALVLSLLMTSSGVASSDMRDPQLTVVKTENRLFYPPRFRHNVFHGNKTPQDGTSEAYTVNELPNMPYIAPYNPTDGKRIDNGIISFPLVMRLSHERFFENLPACIRQQLVKDSYSDSNLIVGVIAQNLPFQSKQKLCLRLHSFLYPNVKPADNYSQPVATEILDSERLEVAFLPPADGTDPNKVHVHPENNKTLFSPDNMGISGIADNNPTSFYTYTRYGHNHQSAIVCLHILMNDAQYEALDGVLKKLPTPTCGVDSLVKLLQAQKLNKAFEGCQGLQRIAKLIQSSSPPKTPPKDKGELDEAEDSPVPAVPVVNVVVPQMIPAGPPRVIPVHTPTANSCTKEVVSESVIKVRDATDTFPLATLDKLLMNGETYLRNGNDFASGNKKFTLQSHRVELVDEKSLRAVLSFTYAFNGQNYTVTDLEAPLTIEKAQLASLDDPIIKKAKQQVRHLTTDEAKQLTTKNISGSQIFTWNKDGLISFSGIGAPKVVFIRNNSFVFYPSVWDNCRESHFIKFNVPYHFVGLIGSQTSSNHELIHKEHDATPTAFGYECVRLEQNYLKTAEHVKYKVPKSIKRHCADPQKKLRSYFGVESSNPQLVINTHTGVNGNYYWVFNKSQLDTNYVYSAGNGAFYITKVMRNEAHPLNMQSNDRGFDKFLHDPATVVFETLEATRYPFVFLAGTANVPFKSAFYSLNRTVNNGAIQVWQEKSSFSSPHEVNITVSNPNYRPFTDLTDTLLGTPSETERAELAACLKHFKVWFKKDRPEVQLLSLMSKNPTEQGLISDRLGSMMKGLDMNVWADTLSFQEQSFDGSCNGCPNFAQRPGEFQNLFYLLDRINYEWGKLGWQSIKVYAKKMSLSHSGYLSNSPENDRTLCSFHKFQLLCKPVHLTLSGFNLLNANTLRWIIELISENPNLSELDIRGLDLTAKSICGKEYPVLPALFKTISEHQNLKTIYLKRFDRNEVGEFTNDQLHALLSKLRGLETLNIHSIEGGPLRRGSGILKEFKDFRSNPGFYEALRLNAPTLTYLNLSYAKGFEYSEEVLLSHVDTMVKLQTLSIVRTDLSNIGTLNLVRKLQTKPIQDLRMTMPWSWFNYTDFVSNQINDNGPYGYGSLILGLVATPLLLVADLKGDQGDYYESTCMGLARISSLKILKLGLRGFRRYPEWTRKEIERYRNSAHGPLTFEFI